MLYLECVIKESSGLPTGRVIAAVKDAYGRSEQIVVDKAFLSFRGGRSFLPVWGLSQEPGGKRVQIELPEEAASGANRLWVEPGSVFEQHEEAKV